MNQEHDGRSVYARLLATSGFLGLAGSFGLHLLAELMLDPIVYGSRLPPEWSEPVAFALLAGSVAVVLYAVVLEDLFAGWADMVAAAAIVAQWGFPIGWLLVSEQLLGPYVQLVVHASLLLHVAVALAVTIAAGRGR